MKIIEQFILGKKNQEECEDNIFVGKNYAAVIDGATSTGHIKINGKKGGKYLSEKIKEILERVDNEIMDSQTLIDHINEKIKVGYKDAGLETSNKENVPAAAVVIYNFNAGEIIFVGDCAALIIGENETVFNNENRVNEYNSQIRAQFIKLNMMKKKSEIKSVEDDMGREYIKPLIQLQRMYENTTGHEFSYSTLNGFTKEIRIEKIPDDTQYIVLASDGYPELASTLSKSEELLAELLREDPLMIYKYKSVKGYYGTGNSFDDRAYLKLEIK